ncbi:hypothetical protein INT43_008764 [Umbelopsis isabellina]|uniref:Beta-glucosidase n=1 Tax=Mortierella isabellina TaxID=91625 RepID=A0A8H7PVP6_MORIS|nr:hypothetical protein INT43_008764 [Umbelopsis isabellina]
MFTPNKTTLEELWDQIEYINPVQVAAKSNLTNSTEFVLPSDPTHDMPTHPYEETKYLKFPKDFKYGVSSSAPQSEGAVKEDGRGPTIWDYIPHLFPPSVEPTIDIVADFYHRYKNDISRVKAMGINSYSLTIAWSRIYPLGTGQANEVGLEFYDRVIDELLRNNIEPMVSLLHFDTPFALLAQYGDFMSPKIVADFNNYAETVFRRYGDRVKRWITINEPRTYCKAATYFPYDRAYPTGINAQNAEWHCIHNILVAHGTAVQTYRRLIKEKVIVSGQIGVKNEFAKPAPYTDSKEDKEAADRVADFLLGIVAKPIFVDGDYPILCKETLGDFLPPMTTEEQKLLKGSADFYIQNLYDVPRAKAAPNGIEACVSNRSDPLWPVCRDERIQYVSTVPDGWSNGQPSAPITPTFSNTWFAIRDQLKYLAKTYPSTGGIYIGEFGWPELLERKRDELYQIVSDYDREAYYLDYLHAFLLSVNEDDVNLKGVFAWAAFDDYEWIIGTEIKLGLQYVNFTDPALPRSYKRSFYSYSNFMRQHLRHGDFNSS